MKTIDLQSLNLIKSKKIYFYGLCVITEHVKKGAEYHNLKIEGVFDTTINNQNINDKKNFGLKIISQENLLNVEKDSIFLITCSHYFSVERHLNSLGFYNVFDSCFLVKEHLEKSNLDKEEYRAVNRTHSALLEKKNYINKQFDKFTIPSLDLILTEKCSLKCADCANLMPYFESPKDSDLDTMLNNLDIILEKVDSITELRILGGEPFLFRKISEVLKYSLSQKKIPNIVIYTNGTIVPRAETLEYLINDKIILEITNYGKLSRNFDKLITTCKEKKINYLIRDLGESWDDSANIIKPSRSKEQDQRIFEECCAKYLFTLMHGKIYRCPFSASIDALKKIELNHNNSQIINKNLSKEELEKFIYGTAFVDSCRFCQGRSKILSRVKPARQSKIIREPYKVIEGTDIN